MSDWISFEQWHECSRMQQPGMVFEVVNAHGDRLVTECTTTLTVPFDWRSPPTRFRMVKATPPRRSTPIPAPAKK